MQEAVLRLAEIRTAPGGAELLELSKSYFNVLPWVVMSKSKFCSCLCTRVQNLVVVYLTELDPSSAEGVKRLFCVWLHSVVKLVTISLVNFTFIEGTVASKPIGMPR